MKYISIEDLKSELGTMFIGNWDEILETVPYIEIDAVEPNFYDDVQLNLYDMEECYDDCTVQILTNSQTGAKSVGWWRNGLISL